MYRSLAQQQRLKGSKGSTTTLSMSGLTSIANLHFVDEELGFKNDSNGNGRDSSDKKGSLIDAKVANKKELSATNVRNNNNSDEEVESVDFELEVEEELQELSSNGAEDEELVTMDVTEGGVDDKKQFKEVHTIELNINSPSKSGDKYRVDTNSKTEDVKDARSGSSLAKSDIIATKDKVETHSDDYQSSNAKFIHKSNIKQNSGLSSGVSTGVSTGGTDTKNTSERHNEISDEFLLDDSEDPFAEFDGYDKNYNDLFGSLGLAMGSGMPSKYDNSNNYDQTGAKQSANSANNNSSHSTHHNISHKPLETLLEASEEKDENGLESSASVDDDEEEEEEEAVDDEDPTNAIEANNESNDLQIEYKFEEMAKNLTEKIASLRNELKDEMRKQRNTISSEVSGKMKDLDERVRQNSDALNGTKSEVLDLRQRLGKAMNQTEASAGSAYVRPTDIDRLEREMQLLRSDARSESLDAIRELRTELNRDIKSKVNSVFGDLDTKLTDFKEEKDREMSRIRSELANVANNGKNFDQQITELRDDLSHSLADIERQRKEHNKRLERMDNNLSEETQRFQSEVQRLQSLMKSVENKIQELDFESNQIRVLSRLETTEENNKQCMARIDTIDKQVRQLTERVYEAFKTVDNQSGRNDARDDEGKNVVVNRPEQSSDERDIGPKQTESPENRDIRDKRDNATNKESASKRDSGVISASNGVTDESQPNDILHRMATMEDSIRKICDSFQHLIPTINHKKSNENWSQNRYDYMIRKPRAKSRHKSEKQRHIDTDHDEYTSRTSTSLLSSSSIPSVTDVRIRGRDAPTPGVIRHPIHSRSRNHSHYKSHKSDITSKGSHKCCIHKETADDYYSADRMNYRTMKVPVVPIGPQWDRSGAAQQLQHIRTSSSSLLNLIKKTTKKLRDEAIELETLGNYRFVTEFEPVVSAFRDVTDANSDEVAIKKLKSVRLDVDQKLRKLTNVINQQKSSQI